MITTDRKSIVIACTLFLLIAKVNVPNCVANEHPIADAGLSRYVATEIVELDARNSYDPDEPGSLSYKWTQVSGPLVVLTDPNSATPSIGGSLLVPDDDSGRGSDPVLQGFNQTDEVQICEFDLVVTDGELTSDPDRVQLIIVPEFGVSTVAQQNPPFNPDKPTLIYFGGGDCVSGGSATWPDSGWGDKANLLYFSGYQPDTVSHESWRTYYRYGDMVIVYLSKVAPNYTQMIQTSGWSTGGQPALDTGIRINRLYDDPRYAINQVTELDAPCRWQLQSMETYMQSNELFRTSGVNGEPCRHDHYWGSAYRLRFPPSDILGVDLVGLGHAAARNWYWNSISLESVNAFNHGVVAGAYWSVVGPGKNLHLAQDEAGYHFQYTADNEMVYIDGGVLPEPVYLLNWLDKSEPNGVVLSCKPCENALVYELLVGTDPSSIQEYALLSETPEPPIEYVSGVLSEGTWWTVRVRSEYGATIHADPMQLDTSNMSRPQVENVTLGEKYASIELALHFAEEGHEIVIGSGQFAEDIQFMEKGIIVRSLDPGDPNVVEATVITGDGEGPVVSFSSGETSGCQLMGLTIAGGTVGISCGNSSPTIQNCGVKSDGPVAIEYSDGYEPTVVDCSILGLVKARFSSGLIAFWKLDETEGDMALNSAMENNASVIGNSTWLPDGGRIGGAIQLDGDGSYLEAPHVLNPADGIFSVFVWVKGGAPGQVIISQVNGADWLMLDAQGNLKTSLKSGTRLPDLNSGVTINDDTWHRVGFIWDSESRILYIDDVEVASDAHTAMEESKGGMYIGAGSGLEAGTFWSGLIDDVRIYDRAVEP